MSLADGKPEYTVTDTPWTWLAIAARNYTDADSLLLRLDREYQAQPGNDAIAAHRRQTAQRRREAYADLVARLADCERHRLDLEASAAS